MEKIIIGGDTETVNGKPLSFQFYSEDIPIDTILWVGEKNALKTFCAWCGKLKPRREHVIYIHNLGFDLIELFWSRRSALVEDGGEFGFSAYGFEIRGIYGTPTYCTLRSRSGVCVRLVDSWSFFRGSLDRASQLYCPDMPKLQRPALLGERRFTRKDRKFVDYAMRDAQVTFFIGKAVEELHREFDLQQCISIADLAARVFRHRFLTYTIPQPSEDIIIAGLDAYHGGKNNITCKPGWYTGVTGIDISSAYPKAMHDMPAFSNGKLYRRYRGKGRITEVPPWGVYLIDGGVSECKWPVLFDHSFKPVFQSISRTWVHGHELNEAIRSGEFSPKRVKGFFYDAARDHTAPALRSFTLDFYGRKNTEGNRIRRQGYKDILNSISGKFIQTRKRTLKCYVDIDSEKVTTASELVAGGMFHPFIAAGITAHTRARIHMLEHKYLALHTATDGIFTQKKVNLPSKASRLGDLVAETHGELLMVRNKCYIMYSPDGETESEAFEGKRISKFALHGFQGSVHTLEKLIATGRRTYTVNKPTRLKTAIKQGSTPNEFVKKQMTLRIGKLVLQN